MHGLLSKPQPPLTMSALQAEAHKLLSWTCAPHGLNLRGLRSPLFVYMRNLQHHVSLLQSCCLFLFGRVQQVQSEGVCVPWHPS